MDEKQIKTLENLKNFAEKADVHASLPIVEELQAMRKVLESIEAKEYPITEIPPYPEMPEMPVTDLTETNTLLKALCEKKDEPMEIEVKLDIR